MAAGARAHHADGVQVVLAEERANGFNGLVGICERHFRVALRKPILEHERREALGMEERNEALFNGAHRQIAVAAARDDDDGLAVGIGRSRDFEAGARDVEDGALGVRFLGGRDGALVGSAFGPEFDDVGRLSGAGRRCEDGGGHVSDLVHCVSPLNVACLKIRSRSFEKA